MWKKYFVLFLLPLVFCNCLTFKINKDTPPLIDAGTPLIGHYRNKDTAKAVLYTVLFATSVIGVILFSPTTEDGCLLKIDQRISNPLFYSFLGTSVGSLVGSSVDTAVTYQIYNKKIIALNNIPYLPGLQTEIPVNIFEDEILAKLYNPKNRLFMQGVYKLNNDTNFYYLIDNYTKQQERKIKMQYTLAGFETDSMYDAIIKFKENEEKQSAQIDNAIQEKLLAEEIEDYRKKLINGTITKEELSAIESAQSMRDVLINELDYYYYKFGHKNAEE